MATLTQRDIDNLLASLGRGHIPTAEVPGRSQRRLRVYDFRRPDKFSKDALRVLQFLHENYARALTTFFSGQLRSMVAVSLSSVDQLAFEEYGRLLPNPCVVGLINLPPLPGTALLELHPGLAFPVIDRLFGGPGRQLERMRSLTEIEQTVLVGLIGGMLRVLAQSWSKIASIQPSVQGVENNPLFVQAVPPSETVVAITFEAKFGDHAGPFTLVLPHLLMEPVLPRLSTHQWFGTGYRNDRTEQLRVLAGGLSRVKVEVTAVLGHARLSLDELVRMEAGDVVPLSTPVQGEVEVLVGGKRKFRGRPGLRGRRLAVEITAVAEEVNENE